MGCVSRSNGGLPRVPCSFNLYLGGQSLQMLVLVIFYQLHDLHFVLMTIRVLELGVFGL
jgi:hypothetical protein